MQKPIITQSGRTTQLTHAISEFAEGAMHDKVSKDERPQPIRTSQTLTANTRTVGAPIESDIATFEIMNL